jgi:hypothetical protein
LMTSQAPLIISICTNWSTMSDRNLIFILLLILCLISLLFLVNCFEKYFYLILFAFLFPIFNLKRSPYGLRPAGRLIWYGFLFFIYNPVGQICHTCVNHNMLFSIRRIV